MTVNVVLCDHLHTTGGLRIDITVCGLDETSDDAQVFDVFLEAQAALERMRARCQQLREARAKETARHANKS